MTFLIPTTVFGVSTIGKTYQLPIVYRNSEFIIYAGPNGGSSITSSNHSVVTAGIVDALTVSFTVVGKGNATLTYHDDYLGTNITLAVEVVDVPFGSPSFVINPNDLQW